MSKIKKSDVFGPKQSPSFGLTMTTEQCRYCYNAFNDYDANQERIVELESKLNTGSYKNLVWVERDELKKIETQQEEIKRLKVLITEREQAIDGLAQYFIGG